MRRFVLALSLVLAAASAARAQELACEKYQLENGLTVILHEDHSLPTVAVNLWYRVGSKDEPKKRSGFAHLFEHLMFMGTKRVPGGDFDRIMEAGGGSNNATTSSDRTNYFSSGPAKLLPTLLWLDADRLESLGHAMDRAKLDKQRDVVRNERRQTDENRPYGKSEMLLEELLYPEGHPYHIPVIGTHEDLEAATVQDVKDFFATYYVPNNCSLCVAGDFDKAATKELIAQLFGSIARGATPERRDAGAVKLEKATRATVVDKVQHARVTLAWHSPKVYAPGDAEMDLASSLFSAGTSSRLYKRLVYDDKVASSVSASQQSQELGGIFRVEAVVLDPTKLDAAEKAIDEELARFLESGPTAPELARARATAERVALERLEGIEQKADKLNEYEYFFGEPDSAKRDLERYRSATVESIKAAARRVLVKERVVVRVLPDDPELAKSRRDERPKDGAATKFAPPAATEFQLANGATVRLWRRDELPLVSVRLLFPGEPLDPSGQQAGLEPLTASLMKEGAGDLDALAFGDALQEVGAELDVSAGRERAEASLQVLTRNLPRASELLSWAIRKPRLEAKELERVKRLHLEHLAEEEDDPTNVAAHTTQKLLYGEGRWAVPTDGTPETVEPLTIEDVKRAHGALFRPDRLVIHVAGAIGPETLKPILEKAFGDWKAETKERVAATPAPAVVAAERLRVVIVDRTEAVQTVLRFHGPSVPIGDPNRVKLRVLNTILGGSFTSRLNANLREAKGYTYGCYSRFGLERRTGTFSTSTSVKADVTGASLKELLAELERIRKGGITDDEVQKAKETIRTEVVQAFAGLRGVLGVADELVFDRLPLTTTLEDLAALETVGAKELDQLARDAIALEKGVLVLVGDEKSIQEQIKDLGLPKATVIAPKPARESKGSDGK